MKGYKDWFEEHAIKHKNILSKLNHLNDEEIIRYFRFENMVQKEKDFCPLYKDNQKCHDIKELNCYFCACPNFRLNSQKSFCDIDSINGGSIETKDGFIHQDCSKCSVPHKEVYIKNKFDRDWKNAMRFVMKDAK
ncbi:MAG TPA: hypothetical protein EYG97_03430 [Arcobacter sp.]|nr:hypothetical protein [Arcobacter sp.]